MIKVLIPFGKAKNAEGAKKIIENQLVENNQAKRNVGGAKNPGEPICQIFRDE